MQLDPYVKCIETVHEQLGFELGWRFLYGSARTLDPVTKLMFAGFNPGGTDYEAPLVSVEAGNAYRLEWWSTWPLGREVNLSFEGIADHLRPKFGKEALMDATLTTPAFAPSFWGLG